MPEGAPGPGPRAPQGRTLRRGGRRHPARLPRVPELRRGGRRAVPGRPGPRPPGRAARQAMEEFQQVRNRFPRERVGGAGPGADDGPLPPARVRQAHVRPRPRLQRRGRRDPRRTCARSRDPRGTLWIASEKTKSAVPLDPAGKPGSGLHRRGAARPFARPRAARSCFAARSAVRVGPKDIRSFTIPTDKAGVAPEPLERINAAAMTPGGSRPRGGREAEQGLPLRRAGRVPRHVSRSEGREEARGHAPLRGRRGRASCARPRREDGAGLRRDRASLLRTVGPTGLAGPWTWPSMPSATPTSPTRSSASSSSRPRASSCTRSPGPELRRPKAIALDPTGAILVCDDRAEKVLRYR